MIEKRIDYLKASIKDCEFQISNNKNKNKLLLLNEDKICYINELRWLEELKSEYFCEGNFGCMKDVEFWYCNLLGDNFKNDKTL